MAAIITHFLKALSGAARVHAMLRNAFQLDEAELYSVMRSTPQGPCRLGARCVFAVQQVSFQVVLLSRVHA